MKIPNIQEYSNRTCNISNLEVGYNTEINTHTLREKKNNPKLYKIVKWKTQSYSILILEIREITI